MSTRRSFFGKLFGGLLAAVGLKLPDPRWGGTYRPRPGDPTMYNFVPMTLKAGEKYEMTWTEGCDGIIFSSIRPVKR